MHERTLHTQSENALDASRQEPRINRMALAT
jgi:hypothetical protein